MRWQRVSTAVAIVAACLVGCSTDRSAPSQIVVTTNILGDITATIVGDQADVTVLMKPETDPHSFGVSAREAARMESADLLIYNGLGLEEGVLRHVDAAAAAGVSTLPVGERIEPIDYAPARADPHYWTDPHRIRTAVDLIAERVITDVAGVDPTAVRANAERYSAELDSLDREMRQQFDAIPRDRRKLVTNHHVLGYLAQRYGFDVVGAVLPNGTTLASPSPADVRGLADTVRSANVPAIFADSSHPDRLARVLAEEAGLHVDVVSLYSESLRRPGGGAETYLAMMRANARAIADALQ